MKKASSNTPVKLSSNVSNQNLDQKGNNNRHKTSSMATFIWMIVICVALIITGIFFCATMIPNEISGGPSTNSMINGRGSASSSGAPLTLKQKILGWLPNHISKLQARLEGEEIEEPKPDWSQEFWSPTDVDVSNDPTITLCKLNFKQYSESPHLYPMFRDLEGNSNCFGNNRRREKLSVLMKEIADQTGTPGGRVIPPTGFVFHESRVGSTLVANTLASDPFSIVFSESAPAANALLHCESCSRERNIQIFRDVVTLMGRTPIHNRLFFKFQSITSTKMEIALEVGSKKLFVFPSPLLLPLFLLILLYI